MMEADHVYVYGQEDDYGVEVKTYMPIEQAAKENRAIVQCAYPGCTFFCTHIDSLWPWHSEFCRCDTHWKNGNPLMPEGATQ